MNESVQHVNAPVEISVPSPAQQRAAHGWLSVVLGLACVAMLAAQALLIGRVNVNWDEFLFLSQVHSGIRGELTGTFQVAFTHLFEWLPVVGDEMAQVLTARAIMYVLFVLSAFLIFRLASRWASTPAALVAPLCFMAASPVLRHGASFRTDSLMLPLLMGTLVLVTRPRADRRYDVLAGVLFGLCFAVSVKTALFLPLLAVMVLTSASVAGLSGLERLRALTSRWLVPTLVAAAVAAAILILHTASIRGEADSSTQFISSVTRKMLLEVPFLRRWSYFEATRDADLATWLLIGGGAAAAVFRRRWDLAACALALLPIAVYRNAFPYFYVLMLAPAAVLAAAAVEEVQAYADRVPGASRWPWIPLAISAPLLLQAGAHIGLLQEDTQWHQRQLIAAVHQVFPRPVPYLDHSGMIASFPKVNFFMSSASVEAYRKSRRGFMRDALIRHRPPLLLANRGAIDPLSPSFRLLLPEDRELIERFYLLYWGPIWVAGGQVDVTNAAPVPMTLPFPGRYRVVAKQAVTIDGIERENGDVVEVKGESCLVGLHETVPRGSPVNVTLVTAEARQPPPEPFTLQRIYLSF
jgi:hypothetical protein